MLSTTATTQAGEADPDEADPEEADPDEADPDEADPDKEEEEEYLDEDKCVSEELPTSSNEQLGVVEGVIRELPEFDNENEHWEDDFVEEGIRVQDTILFNA
jgi:hypothetical protein